MQSIEEAKSSNKWAPDRPLYEFFHSFDSDKFIIQIKNQVKVQLYKHESSSIKFKYRGVRTHNSISKKKKKRFNPIIATRIYIIGNKQTPMVKSILKFLNIDRIRYYQEPVVRILELESLITYNRTELKSNLFVKKNGSI